MEETVNLPVEAGEDCVVTARKCAEGSFVFKDAVIIEYCKAGEDPKKAAQKIRTATEGVVSFLPGLAAHFGTEDKKNTLLARKLVLLVDLDQTLVHTTNRKPIFEIPEKSDDLFLFRLDGNTQYTKLRPYTKEFLVSMGELFEMHIVTFGQRQYAHKIAEIIDPEKKFFSHRVLSRDEIFSQQHKTANIAALFPCGDELLAIIDDRADVWQYSDSLLEMRPYRYFPDVGDINAPNLRKQEEREGKKEKAVDEQEDGDKKDVNREDDEALKLISPPADKDDTLIYTEKVLRSIHEDFYKHYDETGEVIDLKVVISQKRQEVLKECTIVLSGVIPLEVFREGHDFYRWCVSFGAVVQEAVDRGVTHVVAARWGSRKVHEASKLGIPIVSPQWLLSCIERWEKVEEKDFILTADSSESSPRKKTGKKPLSPIGSAAELVNTEIMSKNVLADMNIEVDEALSEEDDGEEEEDVEESTSSAAPVNAKKRKRCPEANDGYGGLEEESFMKRSRDTSSQEDEDEFEQEEDAEGDEGEKDYGDGWGLDANEERAEEEKQELEWEGGEGEIGLEEVLDEDDTEFDDMAAMVENQLSREEDDD